MAEADPAPEPDRIEGLPHPRETARLFGQDAAERGFLAAWADGRLHQGWLIRGPRGIGKATLAYRIARALIAGGPPGTLDTPAHCPVAARIRAGAEPCLAVLRRSVNPKTNKPRGQITVDEVRAIRQFLSLSAADGGWRAVIVDAADEMNLNAANAILKALEEPPARTVFLLVTHAPGSLLPTIRSRCRTLDLRPLVAADLTLALAQAGTPVPPEQAEAVAALAQGSVGAAAELVAGDGAALYARLVGALGPGGVDRAAMLGLADLASARGGEAGYALMVRLILTLAARLARHGAAGALAGEAAPGEAALLARASPEIGRAHV